MNSTSNVSFMLLNAHRYSINNTVFIVSVFALMFTPKSFYVLFITIFFIISFVFLTVSHNLIKIDTFGLFAYFLQYSLFILPPVKNSASKCCLAFCLVLFMKVFLINIACIFLPMKICEFSNNMNLMHGIPWNTVFWKSMRLFFL